MITKIDKTHPKFKEFSREIFEDSYSEHRRGSNFFTRSIIEINEEYYPEYPELWGFWETNNYISDSEYGTDWDQIEELTRVEQKERTIVEKYRAKVE